MRIGASLKTSGVRVRKSSSTVSNTGQAKLASRGLSFIGGWIVVHFVLTKNKEILVEVLNTLNGEVALVM